MIEPLADSIGAYAVRVDVGDPASVEAALWQQDRWTYC